MDNPNILNMRLVDAECDLLERLCNSGELYFDARACMYLFELRRAVTGAASLDEWLDVLFWHQRLCANLQQQLELLPRFKEVISQVGLQLTNYLERLHGTDSAQDNRHL